MADQQPPTDQATAPKPSSLDTQPGSQVPLPSMVPGGVFSPNTEKQVSDLLAEMQQYATTAAPGTTTTMQFSFQKSKHTTETSGQEPQVVESSHVEKAIHQSPPTEQATHPQVEQAPPAQQGATSIFSQIPHFLQEKLGFGGGAAPQHQEQQQQQPATEGHTSVSYHHTKKTTTTTTSSTSSGDQTVTTTEHQHPQPTAEIAPTHAPAPAPAEQPHQPEPEPQPQQPAEPAQEGGFFAPLKSAAEKIGEQVGHIPQLLHDKFGHHQPAETEVQQGDKHVEVSYQHTKKTTTTSSTTSTTSGDQQQVATHQEQQPSAPASQHQTADFQHLLEQATKVFPGAPAPGNVQIEVSKHASRQVLTQSGEQAPHIETTSSGYAQVNQGIFNGVPVLGSVVPVVVSVSITKSVDDTTHEALSHEHHHHHSQAAPTPIAPPQQAPPQASATTTTTSDASSQLEEQLKKLGLAAGHPVGDLLQQTLAQHQRAKTPETNIEVQYSSQRTHSSRTVTYETSGEDTKTAQEALQHLQSSLSTVQPPSQAAPEPPEAGQPTVQTTQSTETPGQNPPPAQGQ